MRHLTLVLSKILIEVSKNVNQLTTRVETMETTIRNTSDKNSAALHGISNSLRHMQESMEMRRCAAPETHKETDDSGDASNRVPVSNTGLKAGVDANKDLLRRLKRGYLVQFDHDEPSEHHSAPARKVRLLDIVKREVQSLPVSISSLIHP